MIHLRDNALTITLDDVALPQDIPVQVSERGSIFLGASWQGEAWSQRNLADDVYDAVFRKFQVTVGADDAARQRVVYTSEYTGWEKAVHRAEEIWLKLVEWFIKL